MICSPDQILTAGFCSDTSSTLFLPRQQFLQRSPASSLATNHPPPRAAESLSRGAWRTQGAVRGAQQDLWRVRHFQSTGASRQCATESTQASQPCSGLSCPTMNINVQEQQFCFESLGYLLWGFASQPSFVVHTDSLG